MKMLIPMERGNEELRDPQFGLKMIDLLAGVKAEAAYFTTINGHQGAYVIVNMNDSRQQVVKCKPVN